MEYDAFETESRRVFEEIPEGFRDGVDGLTVHRRPLRHPRFPGVYTLGECVTESYPSSWEGPETVRSVVLLYWGSFRALARMDPAFDWREQIWETLTHELRHHLESLADRDDLVGVDYAMEQTFLRNEGLDFDPLYYRAGDRVAPDAYAVEDDVYIEQRWRKADFDRAGRIAFSWAGRNYETAHPVELGDCHFIRIVDGIRPPPYIELVLVRRSSWRERLRRGLSGAGFEVYESDAVVREAGQATVEARGMSNQ